ncbi:hypothetical protein V8E52_008446, partial [Russula decolorans]
MVINALSFRPTVSDHPVIIQMLPRRPSRRCLKARSTFAMPSAARSTLSRMASNTNCRQTPAALIVRPRGWHLNEPRMTVYKAPISGSLFDFGLFFYHNADELVKRGFGPYFHFFFFFFFFFFF